MLRRDLRPFLMSSNSALSTEGFEELEFAIATNCTH